MSGNKIRELRKSRGLSQDGLAKELCGGITRRMVSSWETGETELNMVHAAMLCNHFGVSIDEFASTEYRYAVVSLDSADAEKSLDVSGLTDSEIEHVKSYVEFLRSNHGRND